MKNKTSLTFALFVCSVAAGGLRADDMSTLHMAAAAPASWTTLEKQAGDLGAAIQARNIHPIHKIDHAVADETAALQKNEPALAADQKQKLDGLLTDLSRQAHRVHLDGHAAKWDDAIAAQEQFAADLKEAEAIDPAQK